MIAEEERAISVVTVSELLHGVHRSRGGERQRRGAFVEGLLADFEVVEVTERVARVHSDIWATLDARGQMIGAHDLWIAATGLAFGYGVATGDDSFRRVPGLRVLMPE